MKFCQRILILVMTIEIHVFDTYYDPVLCIYITYIPLFLFLSKLGTHGSPRRRGAGHEHPVKSLTNLALGDGKNLITGMHNSDNVSAGESIFISNNLSLSALSLILSKSKKLKTILIFECSETISKPSVLLLNLRLRSSFL